VVLKQSATRRTHSRGCCIAIAAVVISLFVLGVLGPIEKFFERQQAESRQERKEYDKLKSERKKDNE
jgi:hypothetical protein